MNQREEAEKVYRNLKGNHKKVAGYLIERCGHFNYDHQRSALIAEFLRASWLDGNKQIAVLVRQSAPAPVSAGGEKEG